MRTLALTAHVTASVGWLGGVVAALVLAVAGMTSTDVHTVRASYLALELVAWFALVPLACASLLTGLIQALGSTWGLVRHYWILAKLSINLFATLVLILYLPSIGRLADVASETPSVDAAALGSASPVLHAGAALLMLLVATALAVFKPRGLTPYGWRKQRERRALAGRAQR